MEHRDKPDRTLRQLIRDYTIYVTIGVALVEHVILNVERDILGRVKFFV